MTSQLESLQLILIPHRPVHTDDEINKDLTPAFDILQKSASPKSSPQLSISLVYHIDEKLINLFVNRAQGLQKVWRGKKHEDKHTQIALLLWTTLAASHAFFTSAAYTSFHQAIQPALNGRKIQWQNHVLINSGGAGLDDKPHLFQTLTSRAIEVALTKVVEGGVHGYYSQFSKVVTPILDQDPGADGYFISPLVENPQDQLLLINWKSVDVCIAANLSSSLQSPLRGTNTNKCDQATYTKRGIQAHHEEFEKKPTFKACIDGLKDYYAEFVIPWHIVELKLVT
jgi:hypothetical protein